MENQRGFAHQSKIAKKILDAIDEAEQKSVTTLAQQQEASRRHQEYIKKTNTPDKQT